MVDSKTTTVVGTIAEDNEAERLETVKETFRIAKRKIDREVEAMSVVAMRKAITEIADLYELSSYELAYFMEFGEEKSELHFNKLASK